MNYLGKNCNANFIVFKNWKEFFFARYFTIDDGESQQLKLVASGGELIGQTLTLALDVYNLDPIDPNNLFESAAVLDFIRQTV